MGCEYFLLFWGCFFILLMFSSAVQKLLILIRSHLFIFAFISFALGDCPKKTLLWFMSKNIFLIFSSRSFMVSCLIFKLVSNFEFISVYGVSECLTSLIYMWLSSFSNTTCWKDCLLSIVYSCLFCCRLMDYKCEFILRLSICFIDSYVCFCATVLTVLISVPL